MQNYLRRFTSDNEYEDFVDSDDFTTPNVSMIKYDNDGGDVALKKGRSSGDKPIVVYYHPYEGPEESGGGK